MRYLLVFGLIAWLSNSAVLAEKGFTDQDCIDQWLKSTASRTCFTRPGNIVAMDPFDKRTYDPRPMSQSYDYEKREPVKFCSVTAECFTEGTKEIETGRVAGETQVINTRKTGDYVFRLDSLDRVINKDGALQ
ncbi:hypothetical protein SAMN04490186_6437 [Pseudomonas grimontii]|jgi:hypothetical protein|uniref:Uncharacterized protein n=1 Tax=Pseudomonas grimontii TaxID=129847 RepID=A0A1H1IY78_9PSED|nr:hypothetical protein [Pseudomonas grimontii]TWR70043.1 hypothetical protein FIV39_01515 [Pseudomonas grimontii]SDR42677.1 hypothetical protein SAMN04490186_6437 [Pseudomonas grimontii]